MNNREQKEKRKNSALWILCLTALGVVYGDIGTSPLYALRECFFGLHAVSVTHDNVLGVLSLIFWSLVIVVTLKYIVYIIRADNRGEGGILAMMALVNSTLRSKKSKKYVFLSVLSLFGAALLYGDGMLTPAISVLSAVEGLTIATPLSSPYIVPITILILVGLFLFQRRGTTGVGVVFGPIILVWFCTIAILGINGIIKYPAVLSAVNPLYGIHFFQQNGFHGYLVLGAVFLVATGGEALYADLGHFGESPIQIDWFSIVGPSLLLNYFGQGALLLIEPQAARNPFYLLAPSWAIYPLLLLATMATIIASQAVITGVFSLTSQAAQLGYIPRVNIIHTSPQEIGQIYIPAANRALMIGTIGLVIAFRTSSNLAAAYGVAIISAMIITTTLSYFVARHYWHWPLPLVLLITGGFFFADTAFFGANFIKVQHGGWFPLLIALIVYNVFTTWKRGRDLLRAKLSQGILTLEEFVKNIQTTKITRVPGTVIFLTANPQATPIALLHNIKHNKVLHEQNFIVTVLTEEIPHVPGKNILEWEEVGEGFYRVIVRYGFMDTPNVPLVLSRLKKDGFKIEPFTATYILSRNTLIPSTKSRMSPWREKLFIFLTRNSSSANEFFKLPANCVIELGMQIEI